MNSVVREDSPFASAGCARRLQASVVFAVAFFVLGASSAFAQTLTIYDDALQNSFQNFSYGGGSDFNSTDFAHAGTKSIKLIGSNFNAISLARPTPDIATSQYPTLRFWIRGTSSGGEFTIALQLDGVIVASTDLDALIGGINTTWKEVVLNITQSPLSYAGSFDRIDIQAQGSATIYIDDVVLGQSTPVAVNAMLIENGVTVGSMLSDRFTWRDSANQPRVAVLAHNDTPPGPGGVRGGALREFRYQLPGGATRIANVTTYGNGGYGGFGYVVAHSGNYPSGCIGDDSPLGDFFPGNFQRVFEGKHHAIFRFTQNYPRNCANSGTVVSRTVPVTIDWVFSTGRDNPLWSITWNLDQGTPAAPVNTFYDDSRAPYGELNIDGDGANAIDGVAWGDRFKFASTTAPVTLNSDWTWNVANSVPYVKLWITGPVAAGNKRDATMGIVQSQTMTQQDAAGGRDPNYHDLTAFWNKTSADGNAGGGYKMPWQGEWPYQANAFNLGTGTSSNNARLTWRTQWGFLGLNSYVVNDGVVGTASGYPKKSYATYIVLGTHSSGPVEAQVAQVEVMQTVALSATIGSIAASGPAGPGRADTVTYAPAGYDHLFGALTFDAATNQVDGNISVGGGTLNNPLVVARNYTEATVQVKLDGVTLVEDTDYFASLRAAASEVWITLNRGLTGATNRIEIGPEPSGPAPVVVLSTTSKTVAGGFFSGGNVTYTITLTNTGSGTQPDNAGDEFTDTLPASLALTSANSSSGTAVATILTRTVTWNGTIGPGATVTITILAQVTGSGTISNQGTVNYDPQADGTNDASVLTDDPATIAFRDATSFDVGLRFQPLTPCRLIDTRNAPGPTGGPSLGSGQIRLVQATGVCGVPLDAKAIATNAVAISAGSTGWLTLYPGTGLGPPLASTLNYATGKTTANNATVNLSNDGRISVYNSGPLGINFLVDVNGYFK